MFHVSPPQSLVWGDQSLQSQWYLCPCRSCRTGRLSPPQTPDARILGLLEKKHGLIKEVGPVQRQAVKVWVKELIEKKGKLHGEREREERRSKEIWGYGKTVQFALDHLDGRITAGEKSVESTMRKIKGRYERKLGGKYKNKRKSEVWIKEKG